MLILAIDTALAGCSVAVWRDGEALARASEPMARGQAERLAPLVAQMLAQAGTAPQLLDRIAVTTGPGAFTGLRIGLSFARAFGLAVDRPVLGHSTLEALAAGAAAQRVVPVVAVAGSVFAAAWQGRRCLAPPQRLEDPQRFVAALPDGDWTLTGPGAPALGSLRRDWSHVAQQLVDPLVLAGLAAFADPARHPPDPLYLRGADAKLPGGKVPPPDTAGGAG